MILVIDNYDSFSYNLVQLLGEIDNDIQVIRNDERTIEEIKQMNPMAIILSPGPGKPKDAGICEDLIRSMKGTTKILGVCLGHQAICEAFGGAITYASKLMHGKCSKITICRPCSIFDGLDQELVVGRYHSLAVDPKTVPKELEVIAMDEAGDVMAVKHRSYDIYGLQFHPESILTKEGKAILRNFLKKEGEQ